MDRIWIFSSLESINKYEYFVVFVCKRVGIKYKGRLSKVLIC